MNRPAAVLASVFACACASAPALAAKDPFSPQACSVQAAGVYGFQCQGFASTGGPLEPATFIGTVVGRDDGFYEGYGTYNTSLGSNAMHVAGTATFGKYCFGRIAYTTNEILLPGAAPCLCRRSSSISSP